MAILNCNSITRPQILASSALPNDSSSPSLPKKRALVIPNKQNYEKLKEQQPSVLEIERAIGAGIFRDRDVDSESEGNTGLYDNILRRTIGKDEGPVEKKLRESGEWLLDRSESSFRAAGKQILMIMFIWIPVWIFAFFIASGQLQLPFITRFWRISFHEAYI